MPERTGWFFDCVTLSNFALADALPLLSARYRGRGFVVTQVVDELTRGLAAGYALAECLAVIDRSVLRVVSLNQAYSVLTQNFNARTNPALFRAADFGSGSAPPTPPPG